MFSKNYRIPSQNRNRILILVRRNILFRIHLRNPNCSFSLRHNHNGRVYINIIIYIQLRTNRIHSHYNTAAGSQEDQVNKDPIALYYFIHIIYYPWQTLGSTIYIYICYNDYCIGRLPKTGVRKSHYRGNPLRKRTGHARPPDRRLRHSIRVLYLFFSKNYIALGIKVIIISADAAWTIIL